MQPPCARSSWIRSAAVGPLTLKRSSERSASICDSLQRVAHANLASTISLPTVAEWKLSSLPRYLDAHQVARLIDSCCKDGPQGLRDRAIVLLLLRLGLRAGDIAGMRPTDIDWQEATLLVRGKGRRDVRLPLPQDAGDAVLDYIEPCTPPGRH